MPRTGWHAWLDEYLFHVRLFTRNARLYLLAAFLVGINFEVFQLLLNLYLRELGFTDTRIGLVNSFRAVGMAFSAIPVAMALARIRLKPMLLAAVGLFALCSYFVVSTSIFPVVLAFSALAGTAFTVTRVAAAPFYMRHSTPRERTHLFSFSFGVMLLAAMVGSLTAGKAAELIAEWSGSLLLGYRYTLYATIAISLLSIIPFSLIREHSVSNDENRLSFSREQWRRRRGFLFRIGFANFLIGLGAGLIIPFLNLYFRDRFDLEPDTIGLFYFCVTCAMFAGTVAAPMLTRRFGLVRAIVLTQLASIPFMLVLSYTYYLPVAFGAFVIRGGLMNIGVPLGTNFGMEMCERREQGLVNALLMVSWTSAWMISAAIGGRLIDLYGYSLTFNITIALYIVSSVFYYWSFRNAERRNGRHGWAITEGESA
ncbi:MAG: MFS transporter [Candidatus Zixiibacteriota bacterium]